MRCATRHRNYDVTRLKRGNKLKNRLPVKMRAGKYLSTALGPLLTSPWVMYLLLSKCHCFREQSYFCDKYDNGLTLSVYYDLIILIGNIPATQFFQFVSFSVGTLFSRGKDKLEPSKNRSFRFLTEF